MESTSDVIIIGGGLAGLTSAIHLAKEGVKVTVIEKYRFPRHKVCGEYVSNEILPYFKFLGLDLSPLHPVEIHKCLISTENGSIISSDLPLGGFGLSRYVLDNYLYEFAVDNNVNFIFDAVNDIKFSEDTFIIRTSENGVFKAKAAIGAFGKRSNIDQVLSRNFIKKKSPWLAVKAHYDCEFPVDTVALHNFPGGYCGVSNVENNILNICYLANYQSFKKYGDIDDFQKVLCKNPHLEKILKNARIRFEKPITISQVSFEEKLPVESHILMTGDSAGLIHPLCGNGMAMAIHSAKIASDLIIKYLSNEISRIQLEQQYADEWRSQFGQRIMFGRILSALLLNQSLSRLMLGILRIFPSLLKLIIQKTHGKPIKVTADAD